MSVGTRFLLFTTLLAVGCAGSPVPAAAPRCDVDLARPIDCHRACASYAEGHAMHAGDRRGELMSPAACADVCARFNADRPAQPDTVIQWSCLAAHPACSDANRRCQRSCLPGDQAPAELAFCLPETASSGS